MKKIITCLSLLLICLLAWPFDGYHRYFNIDVLHYAFSIAISDSTNKITGSAVVVLRIKEISDTIILDMGGLDKEGRGMTVAGVSLNDRETGWRQGNDKLFMCVNNSPKVNDTLHFRIEYSGIPADGLIISRNRFGDRTFFADNWPDRAHNYLPCIDHPYDKASVDFIITAPEEYGVVANGILTEESSLNGRMKLTHWTETVPIPVKVMTFGAARFAVKLAGEPDNIPVWSWVFPQNRSEGFNDYSIALKPLEYFSNIIGPYPFRKLANVQSKTIYGGLENAGAIFYSENSVTGLGKAERLIAHEIAHQWFGDCVTEADWHHIWLSEGFATYLASMYIESTRGEVELESDMAQSRDRVIGAFEKSPAPLIDTTITNLKALLNINSYQKGAWVLHMLRNKVGEENFLKGLKLFYSDFRNSNVLSSDFQKKMEEASGMDLGTFFGQWLYVAGQPELKIWNRTNKKEGTTDIFIEQNQDHLFDFNLELLIQDSEGQRVEEVAIKDRLTKFKVHSAKVLDVTPDPDVKLLFKAIN